MNQLTEEGVLEYEYLLENYDITEAEALELALNADASGIYSYQQDDFEPEDVFDPKMKEGGSLNNMIQCMRCKKKTHTKNLAQVQVKNGRRTIKMLKGTCAICNAKKSQITK
jgi:hypothetical protein